MKCGQCHESRYYKNDAVCKFSMVAYFAKNFFLSSSLGGQFSEISDTLWVREGRRRKTEEGGYLPSRLK